MFWKIYRKLNLTTELNLILTTENMFLNIPTRNKPQVEIEAI